MKNIFFKKVFFVACIISTVASFYSFGIGEKSADITLSNIEALSGGDGDGGAGDEGAGDGGATVTCSRKCNDGSGQCWKEEDGICRRTEYQSNHCQC